MHNHPSLNTQNQLKEINPGQYLIHYISRQKKWYVNKIVMKVRKMESEMTILAAPF